MAAIPLALDVLRESVALFSVEFVLNATMLHSWSLIWDINDSFNGVSWFLCVTVLFALLTPLIVKTIAKLNGKKSLLLLGVIFVFQCVFGYFIPQILPGEQAHLLVYCFPPVRLLDHIAGCALFNICARLKDRISGRAACAAFIASVAVCAAIYAVSFLVRGLRLLEVAAWSLPSWAVIAALYLGEGKSKFLAAVMGNHVAVFLGNITFEFFLLHKLIIRYIRAGVRFLFHIELHFAIVAVAAFALSLGASIALYYMNRYFTAKRKLKRETSAPAQAE